MNKMLQFFSENKDAITGIGIILTFLISSISLYYSIRNNKAVHYVNSITKSTTINTSQKINSFSIVCLPLSVTCFLLYMLLDFSIHASTASMTEARNPVSSNTFTA